MADDGDEEGSPRGALIALVVVAVLVAGGLWLVHVLGDAGRIQDCVAAGRGNCAPIAGAGGGR
jgi:hypothetical protein